jgi:hypothetical protein
MIGNEVEERVLGALAGGAPRAEAALAGPMSQRSLRRRLKDPDFHARLSLKHKVVSQEIDGTLRALARKSAHVISKILERNDLPALQLKAALAVVPMWVRTRPFETDERLEELEALAVEQETLIQNLNEGIERMTAAILANEYGTNRSGTQ